MSLYTHIKYRIIQNIDSLLTMHSSSLSVVVRSLARRKKQFLIFLFFLKEKKKFVSVKYLMLLIKCTKYQEFDPYVFLIERVDSKHCVKKSYDFYFRCYM